MYVSLCGWQLENKKHAASDARGGCGTREGAMYEYPFSHILESNFFVNTTPS